MDVVGSETAADCIDCAAGKFAEASGSDTASHCIDCSAGRYVDIAGSDEASDCIDCPPGKHIELSGSNAASDCISCYAGKYSSIAGSDAESNCTNCTAGLFSWAGSSACSAQCPAGTFADVAGGTSACTGCVAGTFFDVAGSEAAADCISCESGAFSATGSSTCLARCPVGTFADVVGGTGACLNCIAGKYVGVTGSNAASDCIDCAAGRYSGVAGSGTVSDCVDCAAGHFTTDANNDSDGDGVSTGASHCNLCPAGKHNSEGSSTCIDCTVGLYGSTSGATSSSSCTECDVGRYSDVSGSGQCTECIAGKYVGVTGSNAASDCIDCAAGRYSGVVGSGTVSDCVDCAAGTFSPVGSSTCGDCPAGFLADIGGGTAACVPCVAGRWVNQSDAAECIDCAVGKYGDVAGSDEASDCIDCAVWKYGDVAGSDACIDCAAGKYVHVAGSDAASDCVDMFGDAEIDEFVAAVNSGATGMIGLQISTDGQALELGAMNVISGQDVRLFSTASGTTLALAAGASVATGGMLTISGSVQLTDLSLVGAAWSSANAGTVVFDGGVAAVLPDGTAASISGSMPGTLTVQSNGATVVSIARSDSSAVASFTPSDWAAVRWFGDAEIDEFVAAVDSGAAGLLVLQIGADGQALRLTAVRVVSGQDVRVLSTATDTTLVCVGAAVGTGGTLTIDPSVHVIGSVANWAGRPGRVMAFGYNNYGQLGDGSTTNRNSPVTVGALGSDNAQLVAGYYHSLVLKADGRVMAFGYNTNGQLGDGSTTQRNSPVTVGALGSDNAQLVAGGYHSLVLKSE